MEETFRQSSSMRQNSISEMEITNNFSLKKELKSNKYIKKSKNATKEREDLELPPIKTGT